MIEAAQTRLASIDLIRTTAIIFVIVIHAITEPPLLFQIPPPNPISWSIANVIESIVEIAIPLFIMVSGAVLLQPSKANESLRVFFKKRATRLVFPFFFWSAIYFVWLNYAYHIKITISYVLQGLLTGPYWHFWFIYLIVGLYLLTPLFRIFIAHADTKVVDFSIAVFIVSALIVTLTNSGLLGQYSLNGNLFTFTGYAGYYLLGYRLKTVHVRDIILVTLFIFSASIMSIGTWILSMNQGSLNQVLMSSLNAPAFLSAGTAFLLLNKERIANSHSSKKLGSLISAISGSTLTIYLMHPIILEMFQKGYFGFTISLTTMNPALELPLIASLTFFLCFGTGLVFCFISHRGSSLIARIFPKKETTQ